MHAITIAIACGGVCLHCRIRVAHLLCPEMGGKHKQLQYVHQQTSDI